MFGLLTPQEDYIEEAFKKIDENAFIKRLLSDASDPKVLRLCVRILTLPLIIQKRTARDFDGPFCENGPFLVCEFCLPECPFGQEFTSSFLLLRNAILAAWPSDQIVEPDSFPLLLMRISILRLDPFFSSKQLLKSNYAAIRAEKEFEMRSVYKRLNAHLEPELLERFEPSAASSEFSQPMRLDTLMRAILRFFVAAAV